jgi:hypothetical protein
MDEKKGPQPKGTNNPSFHKHHPGADDCLRQFVKLKPHAVFFPLLREGTLRFLEP